MGVTMTPEQWEELLKKLDILSDNINTLMQLLAQEEPQETITQAMERQLALKKHSHLN